MTYKTILNLGIVCVAIIMFLTVLALLNIQKTGATHSRFYDQQVATTGQTASATTSIAYMRPGTGTTTISMHANAANGGVFDSSELLVIFHASSAAATPSTLTWRYEFSQNGSDWFAQGDIATSSTSILNNHKSQQWGYASSTLDEYANDIYQMRSFSVPTPTRYVRAIFTCGLGGKNCGVWAKFIPQAEE